MNKSELIKNLAEQSNVSLDEATLVVNTFVDCMKEALLAGGIFPDHNPSPCAGQGTTGGVPYDGDVMNKSELIKNLAEQSNVSLDEATLVVNTFVDCMKEALLAGDRVEIRGFGSFKVKEYGSYAGRNPRTGDRVEVSPKRLPFFRAGKELKEFLND